MSNQINGIQLTSRPGTDFATQYNVPDTGMTNTSTLSNSMAAGIYNLFSVNFSGKQTENIPQHSQNDIFQNNGLKQNVQAGNHRLFTQA